jgi:predicted transcriptional regulator
MEDKPARFTILIDADKKRAFEQLCDAQDVTASQMIRRLIRECLERNGVEHGEGTLRTRGQRKGHRGGTTM